LEQLLFYGIKNHIQDLSCSDKKWFHSKLFRYRTASKGWQKYLCSKWKVQKRCFELVLKHASGQVSQVKRFFEISMKDTE